MKLQHLLVLSIVAMSLLAKAQHVSGTADIPLQISATNKNMEGYVDHKAIWDTLFTFPLYQHYNVTSIETNGAHFFSTTYDTNWFFKHYMNGVIFDAFQMDGVEKIRDMAYVPDNQLFYGSDASMIMYEMDLEERVLLRQYPVHCEGVTAIRHIAYDPNLNNKKGGFWIGDWSNLGAVDLDGNQLVAASEIQGSFDYAYGSAYDRNTDPINPRLWFNTTEYPNGISEPIVTLRSFDINSRTILPEGYVVSGGLPGWIDNQVHAGGLCSLAINEYLYLIADFQLYYHSDPNIVAVFELAKIGIEEFNHDSNSPYVMPNPVNDICKIYLRGISNVENIQLYDMLGHLVKEYKVDKNVQETLDLNVSNLNSGVYMLCLQSDKAKELLKIVKK